MKRKNVARNALFTSIISLLLCVSMLVGTTFAWFTDEVKTGMNTIAAGNLDVELLANGQAVTSTTTLFDDVAKWEPGVVVYENLQVKNAGTLALKYQMTLNFGGENDLNGHKLSEVLKVAVINKVAADAKREDVLAAAKAAQGVGMGTLSNFYEVGELAPGTSSEEKTVVVYWAPNENAVDNLYNVNNGQTTSDGQPLHIKFGVNLQATQKVHENDSFGPDYDQLSSILPKATVVNTGAQTVKVMTGYSESEIALDTSFQFLPNEKWEVKNEETGEMEPGEGQTSSYRYWIADYVISADRDVRAGSLALAGYYKAWCGDDGYVVLTAPDVEANTPILLVQDGVGATVHYQDICMFGNDGEGFKCGAVDLTGENAGTTITVDLVMYETEYDPITGEGDKNVKTGREELIGRYTYTFPAFKVATKEALKEALSAGATEIDAGGANLGDLNYGLNTTNVPAGKTVTISNANFAGTSYGNAVDGTVVFENCTFTNTGAYSIHFDAGSGNVVFKNCTLEGWCSFGSAIKSVTMEGCTIKGNGTYAMNRFFQNTTLTNCTIDCSNAPHDDNWPDGISAVNGSTVTMTGCNFVYSDLEYAENAKIVVDGTVAAESVKGSSGVIKNADR